LVTWKRIAYEELGSAGDTLTVSNIPNHKYLKLIVEIKRTGTLDNVYFRFNDDTSNNRYTWRANKNGDTDENQNQYNYLRFWYQGNAEGFAIMHISNISGKEKMVISNACCQESSGSAELKNTQMAGKWLGTDVIEKIVMNQSGGSADFGIGTSITVLGMDTGSTVYDYPDLPNGTIFEDTTDGKHYMWDGVNAWNEMA